MKNRVILVALALPFLWAAVLRAEDNSSRNSQKDIPQSPGVTWDIPKDMQVTKTGSVTQIEMSDHYLFRKLEMQDKKLDEMTKRLDEVTKKLDEAAGRLDAESRRLSAAEGRVERLENVSKPKPTETKAKETP